jgi:hypothetical protein
MSQPMFEVVSPTGDPGGAKPGKTPICAPPLKDLKGRKLGLVWTVFSNGDVVLHALRDHLRKRYPDLEFVDMAPGRGLRWGDHPDASIGELARELAIDAAIVTAGC